MTEALQKKVNFAIRLLQAAEKKAAEVGQPVEICYSGGKDSDVILELAKMSGINYRAIYKNTTIDPPGTIKHCKDNGVEIMRPKESFLDLISRKGYPTRKTRYCCEKLKEYKILDYAVVGVRREESKAREERYKEPEQCREYSATEKARLYYPILEWTKQDLIDFAEERGIKFHPLYYDEQGRFHIERRLGCVGCPLAYVKNRQKEFRQFPGMVKLYIRGGARFIASHPDNKEYAENIHNAYEYFVLHLFCDSIEDFKQQFGSPSLFEPRADCKKLLEDYFKVDLPEVTITKQRNEQ